MPVLVLGFTGLFLFALAYMFYSRFLAEKVYRLDPNYVTPAHELEDGVEYVPTRKEILMGHHFVSVAGAAPIVGPAIALIWGWVPAFLWVVIGTIFASGVHDFGSIWVSSRHKGRSMGDLTNSLISHRARILFLIVIYFLVLMVNAVFLLVIAALLNKYPAAVIPIFIEIPLAVGIGWLFYKYKKWGILLPSIGALAVMYLTIILAATLGWNVTVPAINDSTIVTWVLVFLVLAVVFVAVLIGTVLHGDGLPVMAPALNLTPEGAPLIFPFLFVTIACGAISGFHAIVGSGTTSKQLDKETDARQIGYGGSIGEGILAVVAIMATSAGFASIEAWQEHYASWGTAAGLGAKVSAFVDGVAYFMNTGLGIGTTLGATFAAVVVLSFAATTLDTGLRLQKYVTAEIGDLLHVRLLKVGPIAAGIAVLSTGVLALYDGAGKGGLLIWPLFGTTNQLLASLALLVISVFLIRLGRSAAPALIPMLFLISVTSIAMLLTLKNFWVNEQWYLFLIGVVILISAVFIVTEAVRVLRGVTGGGTASIPAGAAPDDPEGM